MNISEVLQVLDNHIDDPKQGLPQEIFYFVSKLTPMVNVDLLVKDENRRILLSWRDDKYYSPGWHIPGGIIRFKELAEERIRKVALSEIGEPVQYNIAPINIEEIIHETRDERGHFISFLYDCSLPSGFIPENKGLNENENGFLKWHDNCPDNLLQVHERFRKFM